MALAAVLLGAPPATAGGSTSVLVVSPESEEITALYYSDEEYEKLMQLLGTLGSGIREEPKPPGLNTGDGSRQINVTWMAHEVTPWRVDRVYPNTPRSNEVWIYTATDMRSLNGRWHKAKHPAEVRELFKKLGVTGTSSGEGTEAMGPAPSKTTENRSTAPARTAQPNSTTAAAADDGTDWWWALPGAAAGALLARVRLPRKGEPRQELRDV
ncbi:hypothetical protein C4B68_15440 [Streptomyces dengpaensis]|uniref:Uncharacterized protein n=1 Tax=Streptomyces dengpaensis TaxID=2049881 RepID=A0ABM6T240_9ACTN|nr:hypothetical protein C4B68_15440 [Streptomyces dengpaensis]PIB09213.1 hypothetical protein B1C81_13080 [Streptomyces sp. HG99]